MEIFEFNKVVYDGNADIELYRYILKKNKKILKYIVMQLWYFFLYFLKFIDKKKFLDKIYIYLSGNEEYIEEFCKDAAKKINKREYNNAVILSNLPKSIIDNIMQDYNIDGVILYDIDTVKDIQRVDKLYTSSCTYERLEKISKNSYIATKAGDVERKDYKESIFQKLKRQFFSVDFLAFLVIGVINTINGVLFSSIFSLFIDPNLAFIVGYIISLLIAYLLNTFIIFKEKLKADRCFKFCVSYIPNFIIQNLVVIVIYNILNLNKIIAYIIAAIIGIPITFLFVKLFAFKKNK